MLRGIRSGYRGQTTFSNPLTDSDVTLVLRSLSTLSAPSDRHEIIFIDTRVEDYQTLMDGIDPNAEVILTRFLPAMACEQIAEILNGALRH